MKFFSITVNFFHCRQTSVLNNISFCVLLLLAFRSSGLCVVHSIEDLESHSSRVNNCAVLKKTAFPLVWPAEKSVQHCWQRPRDWMHIPSIIRRITMRRLLRKSVIY